MRARLASGMKCCQPVTFCRLMLAIGEQLVNEPRLSLEAARAFEGITVHQSPVGVCAHVFSRDETEGWPEH
jgi:hypothetical protein